MKRVLLGTFTILYLAACGGHSSHSHNHEHDHQHEHETESCEGHDHNHNHAHKDEHHGHNHSNESATHNNINAIELSESEAQTAGVKVEKVTKSQFAQTIPVSGKLQFAQTDEMTISATISGTVNFLQTYTNGTPVKKGGIICTVSSDNIIGGDPTKKIEVTYKIAQEELERKARLLKEKIVTQSDYNAALENYEKARIEYESVLNSKANAGNTIKSPINGYVLETLVSNGDFVNAGDPIAKVVRNNKMMLVADVPLRYQNKLSMVKSATFVTEGSEEVFHTDSLEGKKLPCSTGVSTSNAFITLRWEMNRTAGLWSGSFAKIYLHAETVTDAISIPVTALTDEGGTYYVYVKLDNNHYNKIRVKTGATDGKRIQILEGLHAGNNVVTEGVMCVRQAGMSNIIGGHGHSH